MDNWLSVGFVLPNYSIVVQDHVMEKRFSESLDRDYPRWGYVLCLLDGNNYTPYVVWQINYDDLMTYHGEYCRTLAEAAQEFERRCGFRELLELN
jgi:hypothetical protein